MRAQMHALCNFRCITASRPSDVSCAPQTNPPMPSTCTTARRESGLQLGSVLPALMLQLRLSGTSPFLPEACMQVLCCRCGGVTVVQGAGRRLHEVVRLWKRVQRLLARDLLSHARHCRGWFGRCRHLQQRNRHMVYGSAQSEALLLCSRVCCQICHLRWRSRQKRRHA